ncbi:MAG: hypothetical protein QM679_11355 [Patulibacter sp.]
MTEWIETPPASSATPLQIVSSCDVDEYATATAAAGLKVVRIDAGDATSSEALIEDLRQVLAFPEWCASRWDSIEDAFEDLRELWEFPLALIIDGYDRLTISNQPLALELALRFYDLVQSFGVAGDQFVVTLVTKPGWIAQ